MIDPKIVIINPDKPNIFLKRIQKQSNKNIHSCAVSIYETACQSLLRRGINYTVTLLYMPIGWMTDPMGYAYSLFGRTEPTCTHFTFLVFFLLRMKQCAVMLYKN